MMHCHANRSTRASHSITFKWGCHICFICACLVGTAQAHIGWTGRHVALPAPAMRVDKYGADSEAMEVSEEAIAGGGGGMEKLLWRRPCTRVFPPRRKQDANPSILVVFGIRSPTSESMLHSRLQASTPPVPLACISYQFSSPSMGN